MPPVDRPPTILVGQFLLEANTFAPGRTALADFDVAGLLVGDELRRDALPTADELHAAWGILEGAGATVVPSIRAWVGAGPVLEAKAFEFIVDEILQRATDDIDGVFLSLHGASAVEGIDDPEGYLLRRLRAELPGAIIAVSLDCHAGITDAMVSSADILTGYRTVPHVDLARTGAQAAELLLATLRDEIDPCPVVVEIPMIGPADRQDNRLPVFGALMDEVAASEDDNGILATSFFPSHPWRDVENLCWSVVVVADGDPTLARTTAAGIAGKVWESRHEFVSGDRPDLAEALQSALLGPTPCVIADAGDSPTGGALGNSTAPSGCWSTTLRPPGERPERRSAPNSTWRSAPAAQAPTTNAHESERPCWPIPKVASVTRPRLPRASWAISGLPPCWASPSYASSSTT